LLLLAEQVAVMGVREMVAVVALAVLEPQLIFQ
jgi:hypothetical protein